MASTVLLTPQLVYATCFGADDFARACGTLEPSWSIEQCHADNLVPCEVMWLIAAVGSPASSVATLHGRVQQRSWDGVAPGQRYQQRGDLCIKRERFLMDDPHNDCRTNPGCMDC